MLNNLRTGGDNSVDFSGTEERGGVGVATGEDSGGPVEEPVAVAEEIR